MLRVVNILISVDHLINPVYLILKLLALPVFPFLIVNHISSVSLKLNKSLSKLLIFTSQSVQVLFYKSIRLVLDCSLSSYFVILCLY